MYWLLMALWGLGFLLLWRIPLLRNGKRPAVTGASVSVIVPARNEERTLGRLLGSLAIQTCRPAEVAVIDDHSTDGTADVARTHGIRAIPSEPLPEGWLGKPWACWQGARATAGNILIFLDSDTFLEPDGIARLLNEHQRVGGLLSVQPYHRMSRAYERLAAFFNIVTAAGTGAFSLLAAKVAPRGAFGPCIVCLRKDYLSVGGHDRARDEVLESMGLADAFREAGLPVSCFGGRGSVSFRMYPDGLRSLISGFSRGFAEGAGAISLLMLGLTVAWVTGAAAVTRHLIQSALGSVEGGWAPWAALYLGFCVQIHWMLRRLGNFGLLPSVLYPGPLVFFVAVFFRSLLLRLGLGKAAWKGRRFSRRARISGKNDGRRGAP